MRLHPRRFKSLFVFLVKVILSVYLITQIINYIFGSQIDIIPNFHSSSSKRQALIDSIPFPIDDVKTIHYETLKQLYYQIELKKDAVRASPNAVPSYRNWHKLAYVQYATDIDYLCSAMINFEFLRSQTDADLVLLYSSSMNKKTSGDESKLLAKAEKLGIILKPVSNLEFESESNTWESSFTKFYAFDLVEYDRVIYFDSDVTIRQSLDELFFLPPAMIALPVAYDHFRLFDKLKGTLLEDDIPTGEERDQWINDLNYEYINNQAEEYDSLKITTRLYNALPSMKQSINILNNIKLQYRLGSYIMVIEPNKQIYQSLIKLAKSKKYNEYDMDIINKFINLPHIIKKSHNYFSVDGEYKPLVMIIPHNPYGLLSGEMREPDPKSHNCYLADPQDLPLISYNFNYDKKDKDAIIPYWSHEQTPDTKGYGWSTEIVAKSQAKLIHFSDYPLPKPWFNLAHDTDFSKSDRISCGKGIYHSDGELHDDDGFRFVPDCKAVEFWEDLYENYIDDRKRVCNLDLR
ncbi:glycosyltransferase family 8 protein [[Candida] arabinofermentans NRRL YB-2248]|uniref:Glycosyltransferase family 8 protein n=1 Tax=[Candida] arabinofermentans NRRL YB-2248 TaxID=983967 RepID=A0A1E4T7I6_9ASCO|nr:glycosyltransferase family 8 protein [[Candida] arabinofermentans NRRL YB-2248]